MDLLFAGPASERRRFLDRFVLAIDPNHGARVGQFERALRGRNRLLEEGGRNASWLDAIEREAAELGVAVAAARLDCVRRLEALIDAERDDSSPFPWAKLAIQGEIEAMAAAARRSRRKTAIGQACATIAAATPRPGARSSARIFPIFWSGTARNRRRRPPPRPASKRR